MAEKYVSVSALRELLSIPPDGDCEKCKHQRWNGCYNDELGRACEAIDDAPEADVVEVVRCGDCIHDNSNDPICPIPWVKRMINSFCSFGERRTDNG